MTVLQRLSNEFGQKSHKPSCKPCLTTVMKFDGLDHAKKYKDLTAEHWGKALLSDKSPVQQFVVHTRHVRRPPEKM